MPLTPMTDGDMDVDLLPGSVIVVGPQGRFKIKDGFFTIINCGFHGTLNMTAAHRALVDEKWGDRDEFGRIVP